MDFPYPVQDRQIEYFARFDERIRRRLIATITDQVIAEHQAKPLGQHSDPLERLLNYFRRGGLAGKLGILREEGDEECYRIVRFAGVRGQPAQILNRPPTSSLDQAYHDAFLLRLADLRAGLEGDTE